MKHSCTFCVLVVLTCDANRRASVDCVNLLLLLWHLKKFVMCLGSLGFNQLLKVLFCQKIHLFSKSLSCSLLFRQQRLAEMKAAQMKNKFGEVLEISGKDYVQEVTKAGKGIWVVLHLYKQG